MSQEMTLFRRCMFSNFAILRVQNYCFFLICAKKSAIFIKNPALYLHLSPLSLFLFASYSLYKYLPLFLYKSFSYLAKLERLLRANVRNNRALVAKNWQILYFFSYKYAYLTKFDKKICLFHFFVVHLRAELCVSACTGVKNIYLY